MSDAKSLSQRSRNDWWPATGADRAQTTNELALGCLQRIAAATESMAKPFAEMVATAERERRWRLSAEAELEARDRQLVALRGHNTRLRNEIAALRRSTES